MASKTMLTEFFYMNTHDERAKCMNLLYREFPQYFVWDTKDKIWGTRKRGTVVGRIANASPVEGERYYLRILLQNIRGPTSFDSLKTIQGKYHDTFRDAAASLGLLDSDSSLEECLEESISISDAL
ncbi:UNVERIFIED_CONTAM: hypothetical protein Sradi_6836600 [Sesamum radiatum]|uniref:Uncharacterized protein n=1 Tax=Sesamum radiatum TaxID=300843 RepID=A0AAW2JLK6_SESRA